jgi:hypothetical protein
MILRTTIDSTTILLHDRGVQMVLPLGRVSIVETERKLVASNNGAEIILWCTMLNVVDFFAHPPSFYSIAMYCCVWLIICLRV